MPRYSLGAAPSYQTVSTLPSASTSNGSSHGKYGSDSFTVNITKLRRTWKFAAVCQFLFTFEEAFGMSGFKSSSLEHDLAASTYDFIPDLIRRLLYTLTLDSKVTTENWQDYLREQYAYRLAEDGLPNPMGTIESPTRWEDFSLVAKVRSLYDICEWQMTDPERFRRLVRNEEDAENWRIYPIGFDAEENTYWLFDDNRLWVQHPPPPLPKAKSSRPSKKGSKRAKLEAAAARRKSGAEGEKMVEKAATSGRSGKRVASLGGTPLEDRSPKRTRRGRASIAETTLKSTAVVASPRNSRSRLRAVDDDGWEPIPAELLVGSDSMASIKQVQGGDEDESELSEPPDEVDDGEITSKTNEIDMTLKTDTEENTDDVNMDIDQPKKNSSDSDEEQWAEYETIAITRAEWESMATKFAKSRHADEKALHKLLTTDIIPRILEDIAEAEKAAALEAALAARKRSSRIAMKESEREEREREAEAKAKMEERMRLIRQEEAEKRAKENEAVEEERKREEKVREKEERLRGREERARQREMEAEAKAIREIEERERREKMREMRKRKREMIAAGELPEDDEMEGAKKDANGDDEDWDLDCEICHKSGRNPELASDEQIVCCESCLVWQHTQCWDDFESWSLKPPRNWDEEDFFCTKCIAKRDPNCVGQDVATARIDAYRLFKGLAQPEAKGDTATAERGDKYGTIGLLSASAPSETRPNALQQIDAVPSSAAPSQQSQNGAAAAVMKGFPHQPLPLQQNDPQQQQQSLHLQHQQPLQPPYQHQFPAHSPIASGEVDSPSLSTHSATPIIVAGPSTSHLVNGVASASPPTTVPSSAGLPPQATTSSPHPRVISHSSMGPPIGQIRAPSVPSSPVVAGHLPTHRTTQLPQAPVIAAASMLTGDGVSRSQPSSVPAPSPPRSPAYTFSGPVSPADARSTGSQNGLTSPSPQSIAPTVSSNETNAPARPKNSGAAGSFPIRRPNSSIARSPLSGPSISPRGIGAPPSMSLGEALSGSSTVGLGNGSLRGVSPSPGASASRPLGPLDPLARSNTAEGGRESSSHMLPSSNATDRIDTHQILKNPPASQPYGLSHTAAPSGLSSRPTISPIVRPPPSGAPPLSSLPGAVSPTPVAIAAEGKSDISAEGAARPQANGSGPGPRQGSLADGKVTPGEGVERTDGQ